MKRLEDLALRAHPGTGLQFRPRPYGPDGIRDFLLDLIAMANASIDGFRYIIVGVQIDDKSNRRLRSVSREDLSGDFSYQSLANEFIEPPIRLEYKPITVEGERLGVFCIGDCQDRPYMMRIDHSETLRRGDAWIRTQNSAVRMGRQQLQDQFEKKFRESASAGRVEIGFPGDIIHKDLQFETSDVQQLPSAIAANKLNELLTARKSAKNKGATTLIERMMHTRLFGSDEPYQGRSTVTIVDELGQLKKKHVDEDRHFLFEEHAGKLQLVVLNQGEEEIRSASLIMQLPNHDAVHVAEELPKVLTNGEFVKRHGIDEDNYPSVTIKSDAIEVSCALGDIPPHVPVEAFKEPIRICVETALKGQRLGIHYKLFGQNLRNTIRGKLRLLL